MFDVRLTILHAPNCRTLKVRLLSSFYRFTTSQHFTLPLRFSTLTPRFFVFEFSGTIFLGTNFSGPIFPGIFAREPFSKGPFLGGFFIRGFFSGDHFSGEHFYGIVWNTVELRSVNRRVFDYFGSIFEYFRQSVELLRIYAILRKIGA